MRRVIPPPPTKNESCQIFKRQIIVLAGLFVFLFNCDLHGQHPLWALNNVSLDFDDNPNAIEVLELPTPQPIAGVSPTYFYNGEQTIHAQHCQFDGNGDLLFFIVDGRIYNRDGYLIADSYLFDTGSGWPLIGSQSEFGVTLLPGSCSKFIIFYASQFNTDARNQLQFVILDLLLPSDLYGNNTVLGGLISRDEIIDSWIPIGSDYFTLPALLDYSNDDDQYSLALDFLYDGFGDFGNGGGLKRGEIHLDIIEMTDFKHLLFVTNSTVGYLKIANSGITSADAWEISTNGVNRSPLGELECSFNTFINKWQVVTFNSFSTGENSEITQLCVINLSINFDYESHTYIQLAGTEVDIQDIYGIEISPNGRYAYFTIEQAPYIGYVDLFDNSVNNLPFSIPNIENYKRSRLEMNSYNGGISKAIYMLGADNSIGAIVDPDTPLTSIWVASAVVSSPVSVFPNHTNYFSGVMDYRIIQNQNLNGELMISSLATATCCLEQTNIAGVQGKVITTLNDGTWSYGNNPFGNTNAPIRMVADLIFQTGTNTTINNMVFEFDVDANMIIQKGAKVVLNGTTLTSISCDLIMWPGVNLLGTTNAQNSIDQNPLWLGDQGYLYMENSVIENALRGVEVGTLSNNSGGIIRAYNSTFLNNEYDVIFGKYHYVSTGGNYVQNKSFFRNCTFVTKSQLNNPLLAPRFHVWLRDVDKINFINCSFMNQTPLSTYGWTKRGTGIYSNRSSFVVDGLNDGWNGSGTDPDQTTFYHLRYGIHSLGYNNPLAFYTCKEMEFQFCLYGIVNGNTDNVMIYLNNFLLPDAENYNTNNTVERGIYLTNSTGYTVEQNFFDGYDDPAIEDEYPCAMGIWVDNSGDAENEIRNNDFDEMKLGTYVTRENRDFVAGPDETDPIGDDQVGLQLFCNTYTNGQTDVFRDQNTNMRWVQGSNQGNGQEDLLAGNRFSVDNCNGSASDWINDPYNVEHILYFSHDQANATPDCGSVNSTHPEGNNANLMSVSVEYNEIYNENDCPNSFGGTNGGGQLPGGIAGLIVELNTVELEISLAKNTYAAIVDDNQKQSTIEILSEAFPHESQYYRDLLIARFPLSDEVLSELIAQASRLSSWHLTEVFLANSPLREEMLAEIKNAEILSPFFMNFLNEADAGTSLRTLMEINIMGLATHRDHLLQQIAQAGLSYENDPELESDQLIYLNDYMNQIVEFDAVVMLRCRASLMASTGDYAGAISLVANEPRLANYEKILQLEQSVIGDWSTLDSIQIDQLWSIYYLPTDYSNTMALGILQELGEANVEPEPRFPIQYRSLMDAELKAEKVLPLLGVWPNPASGAAWLHYPVEADENAIIRIYDPMGKLVQTIQLNHNGLMELSLDRLSPGIYVIQLIAFDRVVESTKLTVLQRD